MKVTIDTNTFEVSEIKDSEDSVYDTDELRGNVIHALTWYLGTKIYAAEGKSSDYNFTRDLIVDYLDQVIDECVLENEFI